MAWHVAEGDHVVVDQPLASVETEKAVVEIPSPQSGRIAHLLAKPGEHVQVGAPLLAFEEGPHSDTGTVVGDLAVKTTTTTPAKPGGRSPARSDPGDAGGAGTRQSARYRASGIAPTGPAGQADDGRCGGESRCGNAFSDGRSGPRRAARHGAQHGARRARGRSRDLARRSRRRCLAVRRHNRAAGPRRGFGMHRRAASQCKFHAAALSLAGNPQIDLGLAIDSPDGLFVPVLRDVGRTGPADWRRQIDAFKTGVRERSLAPADLRNPTITLSNFGTIAGQHAALVIVPPQVAILGAGRIMERAVRGETGLGLHRMLPLSLTFDHRAITGGEAARFLRAIMADLEKPG